MTCARRSFTRRCVILGLSLLAALCLFRLSQQPPKLHCSNDHVEYSSFLDEFKDVLNARDVNTQNQTRAKTAGGHCTMQDCFDLDRCRASPLRVHVYTAPTLVLSPIYARLLAILRHAPHHYEPNATRACLFIAALDTLDGDPRSENHARGLPALLRALPHWLNGGRNHLVFNLYAGTWPDYSDRDALAYGERVVLARASCARTGYRRGFDVSLPLFHAELAVNETQARGMTGGEVFERWWRDKRRYRRRRLLTFKGKRYLTGVGGRTRAALHRLNNGRDVLLLTTCRHGVNWREFEDERCARDERAYGRHDYAELMRSAVFCLVPRGRRLATYRFLEALREGCIPVLLSNNWVIPFSEIIDWKKAVVMADERLLTQIPAMLREIPYTRIIQLRQYALLYYQTYFSSMEKILYTTFEIIGQRIHSPNSPRLNTIAESHFRHRIHHANQCRCVLVCADGNNSAPAWLIARVEQLLDQLHFIGRLITVDCGEWRHHNENRTVVEHVRSAHQDYRQLMARIATPDRRLLFNYHNCLFTISEMWLARSSHTAQLATFAYQLWLEDIDRLVGYDTNLQFTFLNMDYMERTLVRLAQETQCTYDGSFDKYMFNCVAPQIRLLATEKVAHEPFIGLAQEELTNQVFIQTPKL